MTINEEISQDQLEAIKVSVEIFLFQADTNDIRNAIKNPRMISKKHDGVLIKLELAKQLIDSIEHNKENRGVAFTALDELTKIGSRMSQGDARLKPFCNTVLNIAMNQDSYVIENALHVLNSIVGVLEPSERHNVLRAYRITFMHINEKSREEVAYKFADAVMEIFENEGRLTQEEQATMVQLVKDILKINEDDVVRKGFRKLGKIMAIAPDASGDILTEFAHATTDPSLDPRWAQRAIATASDTIAHHIADLIAAGHKPAGLLGPYEFILRQVAQSDYAWSRFGLAKTIDTALSHLPELEQPINEIKKILSEDKISDIRNALEWGRKRAAGEITGEEKPEITSAALSPPRRSLRAQV